MALLEARHVTKIFGDAPEAAWRRLEAGADKAEIREATGNVVAVNDVSFDVHAGEIFVVMGLSGSGKSTLLRCINRLVEPTRGSVRVDGEEVLDASSDRLRALRRATMSMVFQNFGLFPHRTVQGNVEYGLEVSGVGGEAREKRVQWALSLVGLEGYAESRTTALSGGMQQRVGLARALANDPEILLMDEAFSALDPLIRAEMQRELLELQAELHRTIVFITHDLDEALTLGDRIAIMREGRMVQVGTPEEILRAPANAYVRSFVQNVDRTQVLSVEALMTDVLTVSLRERITATEADRPPDAVQAAARRALRDGSLPADPSVLYVVDAAGRPLGRWTRGADPAVRTDVPTVAADASIAQALSTVLDAGGPVGVVDADGRLVGTIDREAVLQEVRRNANG